jgi:hypothetical protein
MSWVAEFGDEWAVPKWVELGYVDVSWHNDACPSFVVRFHNDRATPRLLLWVDEPAEDDVRFSVVEYDKDGTYSMVLFEGTEAALQEWLRGEGLLLEALARTAVHALRTRAVSVDEAMALGAETMADMLEAKIERIIATTTRLDAI